jgi:hypothetical protein
MSYTINIPYYDIYKWATMQTYWAYTSKIMSISDWLKEHHDEIIDVRPNVYNVTYSVIFKSEQHYHWFLLQQ